MPLSPNFRPSVSHASLGGAFYDEVAAAEFPKHILRFRNCRAAASVGLDTLTDAEWIEHFGRFSPLPGSFETPLALRYHGHQFRTYNPELGDGRGFLFAQVHELGGGRLLDLGTKGSGLTPWSRTADGRLTLKGGVREILATEMLEALGVDTSRTLSLVETGEALMRGDEPSPTRSGVLVRLSHSHIRIGSFQRLLYLDETDNIARLLDYTVRTYMPDVWRDDIASRAVAFLEEVSARVAATCAAWMLAGFVHGVLNTDNINVTGESFDYGPWRFLPVLDPTFTAAYFDDTGLYAYGRQPDTLLWNLTRLAECLLPFAGQAELETVLRGFESKFQNAFNAAMLRRLGLRPAGEAEDTALVRAVWKFMLESKAPFEQVFFDWYGGLASETRAADSAQALHYASPAFAPAHAAFAAHEAEPGIRLDHAYFAKKMPCTMLIDQVEDIWTPIAEADDWSRFHSRLVEIAEMREAYAVKPAG
ncbi:MAG: YdiU family protein [Alphaproteobacteria bacterium]|nr:YdiU family protein [Alphaproteobacteria bacterium]MBU0804756.1 YdiU family protein [Alphaproteobacteria bacterium]MBU0873216.1 YdiU family protein [Alphaproteobacteria bacterium]MBU1403303.1 YdiU family protein [Alphaproteobacteria bacterium]MBU1589639.1 YdiU family protein [Alphaproteobacteria bacterium]